MGNIYYFVSLTFIFRNVVEPLMTMTGSKDGCSIF